MKRASSQSWSDGDKKSEEACLDAALRYLGYRARSEAELRKHLQKRGFSDERVEQVLLKLREKGFADDSAFAKSWMENRECFSPRSRALLRSELRAKGIDAEIIAEVTDGIDERSSAYTAAQKKARGLSTLDHDVFRNKLFGFLRRRGFGYDVSASTVNQMWQERAEGR